MNLWNPRDIFIVSKHKTWIGMVIPSSLISLYNVPILKLIYRHEDTKFHKYPYENLVYADEKLPGLTKIKKLKKYQITFLKQTLKFAFEKGSIDNLDYIEALAKLKEIK